MLELLGILILAALIVASIALHELGHMVPAKLFGVKVTEYMIGFGPKIWGRRSKETIYGFKAIPLGGYVKIIGMLPPARKPETKEGFFPSLIADARQASMDEIQPGEEDRVFYRLPVHKRLIVMFGGPLMNLLLAVLLFSALVVGIGTPQPTPVVYSVIPCVSTTNNPTGDYAPGTKTCPEGSHPSPAVLAGLKGGDILVSVNGIPVDGDWRNFTAYTNNHPNTSTTVVVERDGKNISIPVKIAVHTVPVVDSVTWQPTGATETRGVVGIAPVFDYVTSSPAEVPGFIWAMTTASTRGLVSFPAKVYSLATDTLLGGQERDVNGPVSVVGVSRLGGEIAALDEPFKSKMATFLGIVASLNLFLFLFNMLPILPLDGGHIAAAIVEGIRRGAAKLLRRPDPGLVDTAKLIPIAYVATAILIGMSIIVIIADVIKPLSVNG